MEINFKAMKRMTIKSKRAQNWIEAYNNSRYCSVDQVYIRPSDEKIEADRRCRERCYARENGFFYKVILANTFSFTVAWKTPEGNLRVETARNSYLIEL